MPSGLVLVLALAWAVWLAGSQGPGSVLWLVQGLMWLWVRLWGLEPAWALARSWVGAGLWPWAKAWL